MIFNTTRLNIGNTVMQYELPVIVAIRFPRILVLNHITTTNCTVDPHIRISLAYKVVNKGRPHPPVFE